eukprot:7382600-Prymnesium_polylepis.2
MPWLGSGLVLVSRVLYGAHSGASEYVCSCRSYLGFRYSTAEVYLGFRLTSEGVLGRVRYSCMGNRTVGCSFRGCAFFV